MFGCAEQQKKPLVGKEQKSAGSDWDRPCCLSAPQRDSLDPNNACTIGSVIITI